MSWISAIYNLKIEHYSCAILRIECNLRILRMCNTIWLQSSLAVRLSLFACQEEANGLISTTCTCDHSQKYAKTGNLCMLGKGTHIIHIIERWNETLTCSIVSWLYTQGPWNVLSYRLCCTYLLYISLIPKLLYPPPKDSPGTHCLSVHEIFLL